MNAATSIILAIIGVATISVILSANANTTGVIGVFFNGLSNVVHVAISPVTGQL